MMVSAKTHGEFVNNGDIQVPPVGSEALNLGKGPEI